MEFYGGGVLYGLLEQKGSFSESESKFIFCEVLLGLEYLHELNIIYRDLKSENILLDLDGHIKLIDFGLSKQLTSKD